MPHLRNRQSRNRGERRLLREPASGCNPSAKTNAAITTLNQEQRDRNITPHAKADIGADRTSYCNQATMKWWIK